MHYINSILDRRQKTGLIVLMAAIIAGSFMEMAGVSAILPLVSLVSDPSLMDQGGYAYLAEAFGITGVREMILFLSFLMIAVYVIKNVYILFMYSLQYRYVYDNQRIVSKKLMEHYMRQDYLYHTRHGVAELHRNVRDDVDNSFTVMLNLIQLVSEVTTCVFLIAYLMARDIFTTLLIMILMAVSLFLVFNVFRKKLVRLGAMNREATGRMNKGILEAFEGIKEIKAGNSEGYFLNVYDKAYRERVSVMRRQMTMQIAPRPVMETLMIGGLLAFISLRIYLGGDMASFIPTVSVFAVAAIRMLPSFNRISGNVGVILYNKASIEALYKDMQGLGDDGACKTLPTDDKPAGKLPVNKTVEIRDVLFYYPEREDDKVLDHISLEIKKNTSVAFVGQTGAGKTTLADVIMGLLPPVSGHVYADDTDIYENLKAWHNTVGYIPQDIYLLDGTIRENITFGLDPATVTDDEIWAALKAARADDFVSRLPDKLLSSIGPGGVQLSGGQRQRLGIARAILKNPEVLILDEATSALDNETESEVMDAIEALNGTRTLIIIAHRLTTIKNCDKVYEVGDGRVTLKDKAELI